MHDGDHMNGHPLRVLRTQLDLSQKEFATKVGVSEVTISRAENGHRLSPKVRRQLCDRLGMTSEALGLLGKNQELIHPFSAQEQDHSPSSQTNSRLEGPTQSLPPSNVHLRHTSTTDLQVRSPKDTHSFIEEQQEEVWLILGTSYLGQLFNNGWFTNDILTSVKIVLQGIGGMPSIMRQNLLASRTDVVRNGIPFLPGKHVSHEELAKLHSALGESIDAAWRLFHVASNAQVLAVGQALLTLVQQNHSYLSSQVRAMYYSSVYNLIGVALYFQEQYQRALDAHMNAHIASEVTGDTWYIVQCLICQANVYQALGQGHKALQAIEEAFSVLGDCFEIKYIRAKAHLLGCSADSSIIRGDYRAAQRQLEEAEVLLEQIGPSEEFDITSWLHLAGNLAIATKNYSKAIHYLEKALSLPQMSHLRRASTSIALAATYLYVDANVSLAIIEQNTSIIESVNAPLVNKQLADYVQQGLLITSPENERAKTFILDIQHRIPSLNRYIATLH